MINILKFVSENKEWIFSGVGISILSCLARFFCCRENENNKTMQTQKSGNNSINIQSQGNVIIGEDASERILNHDKYKKTDTEKRQSIC